MVLKVDCYRATIVVDNSSSLIIICTTVISILSLQLVHSALAFIALVSIIMACVWIALGFGMALLATAFTQITLWLEKRSLEPQRRDSGRSALLPPLASMKLRLTIEDRDINSAACTKREGNDDIESEALKTDDIEIASIRNLYQYIVRTIQDIT
ncbi:hypothetical protein NEOLEDRAFT_1171958 [Neolentinus lepideus HHB14362 ss-1]|uniref:Uncharacterized protein n=1 Tax=Neolentinus lepideus HHB14362 ss-1 TaxID=1314782 RepID=A0A165PQV4_9AGAM|nr:hypothetical protein NEOLEDRAFT_1171958 [Neolentinus lepideus HHB14362 ss-1]